MIGSGFRGSFNRTYHWTDQHIPLFSLQWVRLKPSSFWLFMFNEEKNRFLKHEDSIMNDHELKRCMNQETLTEQLLLWKVIWAWFEKDWPC